MLWCIAALRHKTRASMKITKKVREDAALICQIMASNPDCDNFTDIEGVSHAAVELARYAFHAIPSLPGPIGYVWELGEAESWLRTGWYPS